MKNMLINDKLIEKNMTMYRLSKESGVPQATLNDICSGKTDVAIVQKNTM